MKGNLIKQTNTDSAKSIEVATALFITIGIVAVVIITYKWFNPNCEKTKGGVSGVKNKAVMFKDKYKAENQMIVPLQLNPPAGYDPDSWYRVGANFPEKQNRLRLHEFKVGQNKEILYPDTGRSLESKNAAVAGWFRIPSNTNEKITFFSKTGHDKPRVTNATAEMKPHQKIFELNEENKKLNLNIYDDNGEVSKSISAPTPNLNDGEWHYISFSNGPKYGMNLFLDGAKLVSDRSPPEINNKIHPTRFTVVKDTNPMVVASNISYFIQEIDPITMSALYNGGKPTDPTIMTPFIRSWIPLQNDTVVDVLGNIRGSIVDSSNQKEKSEGEQFIPAGRFYGNLADDVKYVQKNANVIAQKPSFVM